MRIVLNLPNTLSIMRMLLIPPIFILILNSTPENYGLLLVLFSLSVLFDFLDGYFARRLKQITEFGKLLDPVADKLLILFMIIALVLKAGFPLWIAVPIVLRDFLILFASFMIYKKKNKIKPSLIIGKIAFGSLSFLIFLYIVSLNSIPEQLILLKNFVSVFALIFLLWSWMEYYKVYRRENSGKEKNFNN